MAAPRKISGSLVLDVAETILAKSGLEAVTMQALASAVGVKPPSLYKHFTDRAGVIEALDARVSQRFAVALRVPPSGSALRDLLETAERYRCFAAAEPHAYAMLFDRSIPSTDAVEARRRALLAPVLVLLSLLVGEARALVAARALTAFLHGFVTMEANGAFRLGGNVSQAFATGFDALLTGLITATPPR